jgi:hypothetical protein
MRKVLLSILTFLAISVDGRAAARVDRIQTPNGGLVPDAEVDSRGAIHLVYVSSNDVYYVTSADDGKTFSAAIRVNSEPGTAHPANMYRGPDLALGKGGQAHVIWYTSAYQRKLPPDQWGVMYSHLDATRKAFAPGRNLNHKPSDNYSIAADESGRVVVFWMAGGLFYHESRDGGEVFGPPAVISDADTCECCASRAYLSSDGALFCVYRDKANNIRDMFLLTAAKGQREFTKIKLSVSPWEVKGCPMTGTFLAGAKDGLVAAWETKGEVFFTRLSGDRRRISVTEIPTAARGGKWPIALVSADGTLLVSWKKGSEIQWQLFDSNDRPLGQVQSFAGGNPHRHAAVVLESGDFKIFD